MKIKYNALTIIVGGVSNNEKDYVDGELIPIENRVGLRHLDELKNVAKMLMIEESSNNEL